MSVLTIDLFMDQIKAVLPKVYYLTSESIPLVDEKGEELFYWVAGSAFHAEHDVFLFNPNYLPKVKKAWEDNGYLVIDQRDEWARDKMEFQEMMKRNAEAFAKKYPNYKEVES